jgi:hypothetical protein
LYIEAAHDAGNVAVEPLPDVATEFFWLLNRPGARALFERCDRPGARSPGRGGRAGWSVSPCHRKIRDGA